MNILVGIGIIISLAGLLLGIKKYHAPYDAHLRVTSVRIIDLSKPEIKIYNDGPGTALDINVKNRIINVLNSTEKIRGYYRIWKRIEKIKGNGPKDLNKNESSFYSFNDDFSFIYPIVIKYKSIKGKSQKSYWKIRNGHNINIIQTNSFVNLIFTAPIPLINLFYSFRKGKLKDFTSSSRVDYGLSKLRNQKKGEAIDDTLIDKAAKIIIKDIFGKLREFAKATTGNKLEIAIPQLISSTNIEDYVKNITKQEINIINYDSSDDIKRSLENLGHFYKSTGHWYPIKNYERTKEGQIYFAITGDENKVFINAEGLELLNSYLTAFKKEFLKS